MFRSHLFTVFIVLTLALPVRAQYFKPFPEGIGIEFGGGTNQLWWNVPKRPVTEANRVEFHLTPSFRLSYRFDPTERFAITVFTGLDRIGGKSPMMHLNSLIDGSPYMCRDEHWIEAFNLGVFGTYRWNAFEAGIGLKHNMFKRFVSYYYSKDSNSESSSWEDHDNPFLTNTSESAGVRVAWNHGHVSVAAEAWFGITHLEANWIDAAINVHENHFRLYAGYRF